MNSGAVISKDSKYRYKLWRIWDESKPLILWIMLNPSTADALYDDKTIKKCTNYTYAWDYGGLYVGNLFAYRATEPKELEFASDPIGLENVRHLYSMRKKCSMILCAWGSFSMVKYIKEKYYFLEKEELFCLGLNKSGEPKHPLYLKSNIIPIEFKMR